MWHSGAEPHALTISLFSHPLKYFNLSDAVICCFTTHMFLSYHLIPQHLLTRLAKFILPVDLKRWGCFVWLKISLLSFLRMAACYQQCEGFSTWRRVVRKRRDYFYMSGKRAT